MELRPLSEIFPADYINPPSEEKLRNTCHEVTDQSFPYFTKKAIEEHQTESVMAAIRRAATGPAKDLVRELNLQDALGYIDILNVNSTDLYNTLSRFLTVPYDIRNFRKYRH